MAALQRLTDDELIALHFDWSFWARPAQLPPSLEIVWAIWLILAGRGFGKTRSGAEQIVEWAKAPRTRLHLVAETAADAREVMVEGVAGVLACSPPDFRPLYEPSKRRLTWPNGSIGTTFNAREPDQLRGPQCHKGWLDELAKFRYAKATLDQFELGLRLGNNPQAVITTTPRPTPEIKRLLADPGCVVTRGSTYDNSANLARSYLKRVTALYAGTRLGRQELHAEVLEDAEGALWHRAWLDDGRVMLGDVPTLVRVGVGIDPSAGESAESCEAGIVAAGLGADGHAYVLGDWSGRMLPLAWARRALEAYAHHEADRLVVEMNLAPAMVQQTLTTAADGKPVRLEKVRARRGKATRAEPISAFYEAGKVHHVGTFAQLEDQLCSWEPESSTSPDRLDALVWVLTWLLKPSAPDAYGKMRKMRGPKRRL